MLWYVSPFWNNNFSPIDVQQFLKMSYCLDGMVNLLALSIGNKELIFLLVSASRGKVAGPGDNGRIFRSLEPNHFQFN